GGIVAYEIAQQLSAQGQKIGQLLLLDSGARANREEHLEEAEEHAGHIEEDDAALMIRFFGEALQISREDLAQFQGDERIGYILQQAISMKLLPPDVEVAQARSFLEVYRANEAAKRKYVPQAYPGTVTLFKTDRQHTMPPSDGSVRSEQIEKMIQDPTMGWGDLAAGGVRVVEVPGDHHTMVLKPHVETLALRIRNCLSKAVTTALPLNIGTDCSTAEVAEDRRE